MSATERKIKFIAMVFALGAATSLWACKRDAPLEEKGLIVQKADPPDFLPAGKPAAVSVALVRKPAGFDHRQKDHRERSCSECHQRDLQSAVPKYPYHDACAKCHASENYLSGDSAGPFCANCHQNGGAINFQETPRLKSFPKTQEEFGLKEFSHRLHLERANSTGSTEQHKCESCHQFDRRISVASFPSHPECYSCHAHAADQKLGQCQACHEDLSTALAFQKELGAPSKMYNFKHNTHLKQPSIGANCQRCHQIAEAQTETGRSDIARINTPAGLKHRSACWQCHTPAKEPVCTKCHLGGVTVNHSAFRSGK